MRTQNGSTPKPRLKIGDLAPDSSAWDANGRRVVLSDLWLHGPTLLAFLRHFGCMFCRESLSRLEQNRDTFAAAGLQVIGIGLGRPRHAARTCGRYAPHVTCLADDRGSVYHAYGLRKGSLKNTLSPTTLRAGLRAAVKGHLGGRPTGDTRMLPGMFIVDREGIIRYTYYSRYPGDLPDFAVLLQTVQAIESVDG